MPAGGRHHVTATMLPVLRTLALEGLAIAGASAAVVGVVGVARVVPVAAAGADTASPSLSTVVVPNLGPGYSVSSQGALNPSAFASDAPNPSAASGALATLGTTISTYQRQWQANRALNQVQDLVVRFSSATAAQVFLQAAQHSLGSGEIVSNGPLPSIPGARLVTYFAATNASGVGEAITMRSGIYVALLSFFSAAAGNSQPITPADAGEGRACPARLLGVGIGCEECHRLVHVTDRCIVGASQEECNLERHRLGRLGRGHRRRGGGDAAGAP